VPEIVSGTVAQVVVALLVAPVVGELALQLLAAFGAVLGCVEVLAAVMVAAQEVLAAAGIAELAIAASVLLAQGGEVGLALLVGLVGSGEEALGDVERRGRSGGSCRGRRGCGLRHP
jgi:hypothetical protein